MNRLILATAYCLISGSAFATTTTFNCELEKYPKQIVTFKMKDLGKPSMTFLNADADDDYSPVFTTKSKNETIVRLVDTLNGQGGDLRVGKDRISFFGDSAGIDFAYLDLFKSSGYQKGFVRIDFNFSNDKDYSKINCKLK